MSEGKMSERLVRINFDCEDDEISRALSILPDIKGIRSVSVVFSEQPAPSGMEAIDAHIESVKTAVSADKAIDYHKGFARLVIAEAVRQAKEAVAATLEEAGKSPVVMSLQDMAAKLREGK